MATLHATLIHNSINNIVIGNKRTDESIRVYYVFSRGDLKSCGKMKVLSRGTIADAPSDSYIGDDVGISALTADISGNNIRLNITVNNSSEDDITFDYNLQIVKL